MIQWLKTIRRIAGFFWTEVWKDSWLLDMLGKFFDSVVGNTLQSRIEQIMTQLSWNAKLKPDFQYPLKILVDKQYDSPTIPLTSLIIDNSDSSLFEIGKKVEGSQEKLYKFLTPDNFPDLIYNKVPDLADPSDQYITLKKDIDFHLEDNCLKLEKTLEELGFRNSLEIIGGEFRECLRLWGVNLTCATLSDHFTGILNLPKEWLWTYPEAVKAAWRIRRNGITRESALEMLQAIEGADFQPQIYTWKNADQFLTQVSSIQVITDKGLLTAPNQNLAVSDNILPLTSNDPDILNAYRQLCQERNANLCLPYVELPSSMNPAKYLITKIWKHSCVMIIVSSNHPKDMNIALAYIITNLTRGAILLIYKRTESGLKQIYPDLEAEKAILRYYNQSVNNNYMIKIGD